MELSVDANAPLRLARAGDSVAASRVAASRMDRRGVCGLPMSSTWLASDIARREVDHHSCSREKRRGTAQTWETWLEVANAYTFFNVTAHSEQKERGWHACVGVSHAEGTVWRTRDLDRWRRGPTVQPVLASLGTPKRQSSRRAMLRSCEGDTLRTTGRRGVTVSIFWGRRKTAKPWKNLLLVVGEGRRGGEGSAWWLDAMWGPASGYASSARRPKWRASGAAARG